MEVAMTTITAQRPINCALGGAVGALVGTMLSPDSGLVIAASTGVGAAAADMWRPINFLPGSPQDAKDGAYSYKLALLVGGIMYAKQYLNLYGGFGLSPTTTLPLLRGGLSGAMACIIMMLSGDKLPFLNY